MVYDNLYYFIGNTDYMTARPDLSFALYVGVCGIYLAAELLFMGVSVWFILRTYVYRTATRMEGRAGVLKAEIRQDAGGNTQAKEAELAETEQKALKAETAQMNTLARANREMKKVSETEQGRRTEEGGKKVGSKGNKAETETGSQLDPADRDRVGTTEGPEQGAEENDDRTAVQETLKKYAYVPIDIRL